jgi:hypothetical protein
MNKEGNLHIAGDTSNLRKNIGKTMQQRPYGVSHTVENNNKYCKISHLMHIICKLILESKVNLLF